MKCNVKVIGCGGIGSCLLPTLCRYLSYSGAGGDKLFMTLIDGDKYEQGNASRQMFTRLGNKAEVTSEWLNGLFGNYINFSSQACFVTEANIEKLIRPNDLVLACVDNYATRKLISDQVSEFEDGVVISGGNEYTDGNIQVFIRKAGRNVTLPLANEFHPEIQNPVDENPGDRQRTAGCDAMVASAPQLLITNNAVAAAMLNAVYALFQDCLDYDEAYVDVPTNTSRRSQRSKGGS